MSLGYDTQSKIDKVVCKDQKHIVVNFQALFGAKPLTIVEALLKTFSREFEKVHEKSKVVRNLQCKVLIKGFSIGEDLGGKTSQKLVEVRNEFEKRTGLKLSGFDSMYKQVDKSKKELPNWTFSFRFYDVDPDDAFTGSSAWNLYKR